MITEETSSEGAKLKPVFVLGVGAQKAGTTWLWSTLNKQEFSNMGFQKEYHIWDAKIPEVGSPSIAKVENPDKPGLAMRRMMQSNSLFYLEYFQALIRQGVSLTGDITPAYAFLHVSTLESIKELIEKRGGFELKVIFLIRDPTERVWSAVRMNKRKIEAKGQRLISYEKLQKNFTAALSSPGSLARTNYSRTIRALESVFDASQIHYEIYEDLFNSKAIRRLEKFIGRKFTTGPDFEEKVNASDYSPIPKKLLVQGMQTYRDQYEFCATKFPRTKRLWHQL